MFKPQYRTDVTVTDDAGITGPINPEYALSDDSARELSSMLSAIGYPPNTFLAWPLYQNAAGPMGQSGKVPYFDFETSRANWTQEQYEKAGITADNSSSRLKPGISNAGLIAKPWKIFATENPAEEEARDKSATQYAIAEIKNLIAGN